MRLALLLVLLAACAGAEERRGLHPLLYALPVLTQGADAVTTVRARQAGAVESNCYWPSSPNGRLILGKTAVGLAISGGSHYIARKGHRRAAKVLIFGVSALAVGASIRNERNAR